MITYSFSSSYDKSWNFDWSRIRPQIKDSIKAIKNHGSFSFGTRGNGRIETKQFNRQKWVSKNAFDYELVDLLDYPDGTVKGLSYQTLIRKNKKMKYELLKKSLNDSLTFVHYQIGCIGSALMLNEFISLFSFNDFYKDDYSHLKEGLTKKQFSELKTIFINRKIKEEIYKKLYREAIN